MVCGVLEPTPAPQSQCSLSFPRVYKDLSESLSFHSLKTADSELTISGQYFHTLAVIAMLSGGQDRKHIVITLQKLASKSTSQKG